MIVKISKTDGVKILSGCVPVSWLPNYIIFVLTIGYLFWLSSWWWQPHIGGCKFFSALLRGGLTDFGQFFLKIYLSYMWRGHTKKMGQFRTLFPLQNGCFLQMGRGFSRKVGNFPDMWAETYVSGLLVSYSFFCKIYPLVVLVVVLVVIHRF